MVRVATQLPSVIISSAAKTSAYCTTAARIAIHTRHTYMGTGHARIMPRHRPVLVVEGGGGGDVVVLNATVKAPSLLALVAMNGNGNDDSRSSVKDRLVSLLASEPGIGVCDSNIRERTANVVTSAPFFMNGVDLLRRAAAMKRAAMTNDASGDSAPNFGEKKQKIKNGGGQAWGDVSDHRVVRRYGLAMFGVGAAAMAYHLTPLCRRKARVALRQIDFTSIALASTVASEAYGCRLPQVFKLASIAAAPRFPLLVSGLNCAASEVAFFNKATRRPAPKPTNAAADDDGDNSSWGGSAACRRCYAAHAVATLGAAFFFTAEEVWPDAPFLHAAWHCFGAAAIGTGNQVIMGGQPGGSWEGQSKDKGKGKDNNTC